MIELSHSLVVIAAALLLASLLVVGWVLIITRALVVKGQLTFNFDGLRARRLKMKAVVFEDQEVE